MASILLAPLRRREDLDAVDRGKRNPFRSAPLDPSADGAVELTSALVWRRFR